ncbi:hypothetical protein COCON_G00176950 [Conger conger]|uniref:Uncharacterized protein n=1 Tax=Conger conger TaxID=82655 RepID=A0A9Q1D5F8_CONCO|nr:hypothetical protein COCON_G00176950 [Conger conger]
MAASQRRMNESWVRLALSVLFCTLILHNGVLSDEVTDAADGADPPPSDITETPALLDALGRGDGDPTAGMAVDAGAADPDGGQAPPDTPDPGADDGSDAAADSDSVDPTPKDDASDGTVTDPQFTVDVQTLIDAIDAATAPNPGEAATKATGGDEPRGDIQCVDKDALKDKDVVRLELKDSSSCEETKAKMKELLGDLCGPNCDMKIFQEESSSQIIVSGDDVEADPKGMAGKFSSEGIKEKLGLVEATPKWGKHPPTVLVSLLLTGLLLAALLIGGYCLRNHRSQPAKGTRLAEESFPVDQENQGNTLVSVAPLHPQEPQEKPSANGESPEGVKTEAPPTNGHSTAKSPVADTEL